jgi:M6 family metalloprotease-like protein
MRKGFFYWIVILLFFATYEGNAVPACPYPIEQKQPDGSVITIMLKGDERVHWATSADGYTLLLNADGFYEYAQKTLSGDLELSGVRAHNPDKRTPDETGFLKKVTKDLRYSHEQVNLLKQVWDTKKNILKSKEKSLKKGIRKANAATGTVHAPLVLVQFPGKPFTKSKQDFEMLMNQPNYTANETITGSVYDYFYDNSYGQLEFKVDVFGPYTLEKPIRGYDEFSGGNPAVMAREAALAAAADGCNFSNYDSDGDDFVDALHLIFAGYGQEAGAPAGDAIWSHSYITYTEEDGNRYYLVINDKIVYSYSCSPELRDTYGSNISHIGVIAHELSHVFGLPDFYDTDYSHQGQSIDTGTWDIMAGGSWNDNGRTPANHNAWSKNYLGWVPAAELSVETAITLPNPLTQGAAYRINTSTPNEYFLLENRQKQAWDAYIPSSGMLVYHVDENMDWSNNCLNCNPSHRGFYIKQAGGGANSNRTNRTNDPYPSSNNTAFSDTSVPDSKSWAGNNTAKPVTQITQNTGERTVSFQFMESPDYYDAALICFVDLLAVSYSMNEREIRVDLENQGRTFTSATITWSIDNQAQTPYTRTGSFTYGQKETLTLGRVALSAGVHTLSATVTVSGDVNVENNTISANIEIKDQERLPYATEFNGSLNGWESVDIVGGIDWQWSNLPNYWGMPINTGSYANGYALYGLIQEDGSVGPNSAQAALVSPIFDFSNVENSIDLSFEGNAISYIVAPVLRVQVSTDNFQNHITDVWSYTLLKEWELVSFSPLIDLSAFAGEPNVRIRFLYEGGFAYGWAIDDIKIAVNNTPRLKSLTVSSGTLSPDFNPTVTNYTVKVTNEVNSINIQAEAVRSSDGVSGTGTKNLDKGYNVFPITVTASDNSEQNTYTVSVKQEGQVFAVPFTEDFESDAPDWTTVNGEQVNQWHIGKATASGGDFSAYISNDGGLSNSYSNVSSAVFLYCDVYFTPLSDNSLVYELSFDWKGIGESYCDYVEIYLTDTDTEPVAGDRNFNGQWIGSAYYGDNWQKLFFNLPGNLSGTTKRLIFRWINDSSWESQPPAAIDNVTIQAINPSEALLGSLTVSEGILTPDFDPNTFDYSVLVTKNVSHITINASATHDRNYIYGTGTYYLNEGDNSFEIQVFNPDYYTQNVYRVVVRRLSSSFEIPFTEDFETRDSQMRWFFANGDARNQWAMGSATAASGIQSAYISSDGGSSNSYQPSSSNYVYIFTSIYVTPYSSDGYYQLSFDWKGLGELYFDYLSVLSSPFETNPVAGEEWSNASRWGQFSDASTWRKAQINLYDWNNRQGTIQQLAFMWVNNSGIERQPPVAIDNISIKYLSPTDATLSSLSASWGVLSPAFAPDRFNYRIDVDKSVSRIRLNAEANHPNAAIVGATEVNLNMGENTFTILVVAENPAYRNSYSVTVNRGAATGLENPEAALKVYPVPTTGRVYIENAGEEEIFLYSLPGELLLRTRENSIDLSAYPRGVYLLQTGERKVKVVKQ